MDHFYLFILLLYLIKIIKAEVSLEIFKNINGEEIPVYDILQETAGTNLTLTCKLITSNDTDPELSWGRKRKNVQFDNITDLQKLAKSTLKPLLQFRKKNKLKEAVIQFYPLFLLDSGKYFCMSLKYNLFKIVDLSVSYGTDLSDLANFFQALNNSPVLFNYDDLNKPLGFPKFMCTDDMFICNSGKHCFNEEYVCDGIKDCEDGSDENFYLCGIDPCAGKKRCLNGRCISHSLCCDRFRDIYCTVNVAPDCCFETDEKYDVGNEENPVVPLQNDDYNPSIKLNKPGNDVQTIWKNENQYSRTESLWIVVPCFIILILVIICIMIRQTFMKPASRTRFIRSPRCMLGVPVTTNNRESSSGSDRVSSNSLEQCSSLSRSISPNVHPHFDLPPSYDEVMRNSPSVFP